jgi:ParB family transcriptional regulator, chromosome partitioning protein
MAVRGLGKGLGALLGDTGRSENQNGQYAILINVDSLRPNRYQPRKYFSTESLEELAASIKAQGVLQPILVRPGNNPDEYELVAGERRLRASKQAGLRQIPAIIKDIGDKESLALALIENVQREDLNALEQAQALQQLQVEFQATQNELAERTGLSRSHIANLLRLLQLPEHLQKDIQEKLYTAGHGRVLAGITSSESQITLRDKIIADDLSVRESERHAAYWKQHGRFGFQARQEQTKPLNEKNEQMARYEEMVVLKVGLKGVKFRGTEEKGSMTMRYGSRDELARLLGKLGVEAL